MMMVNSFSTMTYYECLDPLQSNTNDITSALLETVLSTEIISATLIPSKLHLYVITMIMSADLV